MPKYADSTGISHLMTLIKTALSGKQETLVSGTNIKTINNESLLGSGNITISGGGGTDTDFTGATSSTNGVHGLVPAPEAGDNDFGAVLMADGNWTAPLNSLALQCADDSAGAGPLVFDGTNTVEARALTASDIPNLAASKITSGTMSQLRVEPIFYQARNSAAKSLTAGNIAQLTLTTTSKLSSGSGLSIASGGIKIENAGTYRITGSVQVPLASSGRRGCYIYKASNSGAFSSASEILSEYLLSDIASCVQVGPKIVSLAANDILYLAARSQTAVSVPASNDNTYLLVERLS